MFGGSILIRRRNGVAHGFSISIMLRTVSATFAVDATSGHAVYDEAELDADLIEEFDEFASQFDVWHRPVAYFLLNLVSSLTRDV